VSTKQWFYQCTEFSAAQTEGWKPLQKQYTKRFYIRTIVAQVMSHPDLHNGELPRTFSVESFRKSVHTNDGFVDTVPKEMTIEDNKETVLDFKNGAKMRFQRFEVVELHALPTGICCNSF
jgi:N-ethylmaleimide reductase